MERVSLKMIAARAGVSVAAVSLALRRQGSLSRELAEKIRRIAKEMGYHPNPLLAALASKRFRTAKTIQGTPLAIFDFPAILGEENSRTLYSKSLVAEAVNLGYSPEVYSFPLKQTGKKLSRELYYRSVPGIVLVGSLDESMIGPEFDWTQFSVVQCARFSASQPFHTVRASIFQAVKLVFTQLRERGYRRIGFAIGRHELPMEDDEARYGAAIAMETGYLSKRDQLPVYQGPLDDAKAFLAWVGKTKPDAVVGFSNRYYWNLRESSYRIPQDLGFACLHVPEDDLVQCSGLNQNQEKISQQSVILLDQLIRSGERGKMEYPMHLLIPSEWREGKTLGNRAVSSQRMNRTDGRALRSGRLCS